ncbi:hypothetical protein J3F83DRAFT_483900 [Trichoderma novae-zelandiae]
MMAWYESLSEDLHQQFNRYMGGASLPLVSGGRGQRTAIRTTTYFKDCQWLPYTTKRANSRIETARPSKANTGTWLCRRSCNKSLNGTPPFARASLNDTTALFYSRRPSASAWRQCITTRYMQAAETFVERPGEAAQRLLAVEDMRAAFNHDTPDGQDLLNSVIRYAGSLRGTRPCWSSERRAL